MWNPVGPLPAVVYWRRRLVAVAATAAAIIILAWAGASLAAPLRETSDRATGRAAVTAPQPTVPSPASPAPGTAGGVPGGAAPGSVVPGSAPDGLAATSAEGVPSSTSERVLPDDTPRAPVPVPPSEPVPPTGPVPCTNEMLQVTAEVDPVEHRIGQRPTLRLVVVNVSAQPCVRDLDGARQEIVVWSADLANRLWSSNDCVNPATDDLRTLVPGQPVAFAVRWAGRTSTPGCGERRTAVPPGDYQLMTRVDDLISAPVPLRRLV